MITVDNNKAEITLRIDGDAQDIVSLQSGILDLISCLNFDNILASENAIYTATVLLRALQPDVDQMKRAFVKDTDYLEMPKNITPQQKEVIKNALFTIKTGTVVTSENPVLEAISGIKK